MSDPKTVTKKIKRVKKLQSNGTTRYHVTLDCGHKLWLTWEPGMYYPLECPKCSQGVQDRKVVSDE